MICFVTWDNVCVDGVTDCALAYQKKVKSTVYFRVPLSRSNFVNRRNSGFWSLQTVDQI